LTLGVKDTQPIDFLDKMIDKEKDLKILSEACVDDFLKNTKDIKEKKEDNEKEEDNKYDRYLISSHPYIRKNNLIADKAMN
jgi:hypothetical protein